MGDGRRQGFGLEKMVWDIITRDIENMWEIGFYPDGTGNPLESFKEGRDTQLIQDPCFSHSRACAG